MINNSISSSHPYNLEISLAQMAQLGSFTRWIFETIQPYLSDRILEAGCGIGNFTPYLLSKGFVLAVDIEKAYLNVIKAKFKNKANFLALQYDLQDDKIALLKKYNINTAVCLNVLEHVDDVRVMENMCNILVKDGTLILLVPAFSWLYGTLDRVLEHKRRYSKKMIARLLQQCGFVLDKIRYINCFGLLGWLWNARVLRRTWLSDKQLHIYHKFVPIFKCFENITGPPVGLSLIVIGRKA